MFSASPTCLASELVRGQSSLGQSGPCIRVSISRCFSCIWSCRSRYRDAASIALVLNDRVSRAIRFLALARRLWTVCPQNVLAFVRICIGGGGLPITLLNSCTDTGAASRTNKRTMPSPPSQASRPSL